MAPVALQARYLLPIDGPPIENGVITIDHGKIVTIGQKASTTNVKDLGNVAIMPGLRFVPHSESLLQRLALFAPLRGNESHPRHETTD